MKRHVHPNIMDQFEIDVHDNLWDWLNDMLQQDVEYHLAARAAEEVNGYSSEHALEEYDPRSKFEQELLKARDVYIEALIKLLYGKLYS